MKFELIGLKLYTKANELIFKVELMNKLMHSFLCVLCVVVSFNVYAEALDCQQQRCVGIVDAGSTGSRLHIYTYDLDEHNTPIHITEKWAKKVKPGFATLDNNQATVDSYLTNLVTGAPDAGMPIYFYATAGMRLLSQPKQAEMYNYLNHWFNQQSQWDLKAAKTITGKEEGTFDWLAVNYQLGNLGDESKPLTGVMDMGGASVQITFPLQQDRHAEVSDIQQIDIYGRHISLFVHSFLGLGQTELSHQFFNNETCFSDNYVLPDGSAAKGDARQCSRAVASLINDVHHVNRMVQPAMRANPVSQWYAMGGVVDTVKAKPFDFTNNQFDNYTMLTQGDSNVCHQDWTTLQTQNPGNDYLYGDCLYSAYYFALMVDGYGIDPHKSINYLPATTSADWTIGAVLMQ